MTELKGVVHVLQDLTTPPPSLLYRYAAFDEWTYGIFQSDELYFQSPNSFNDPFDAGIRFVCEGSKQQRKRLYREMQPRVDPDIARSKALYFEKRFKDQYWDDEFVRGIEKQFLEIRGRIGICCMTEARDNILMWSHYAACHTGFCLEFQTDDPFFSQIHPVKYPDTGHLPCVNLLTPGWDRLTSLHAEGLLTKAKEWAYEREWRIIDLTKGVGVRRFPPKVLRGVILGCRVSAEDMRHMVGWCKGREPRPILYRACKKETEFGLEIKIEEY